MNKEIVNKDVELLLDVMTNNSIDSDIYHLINVDEKLLNGFFVFLFIEGIKTRDEIFSLISLIGLEFKPNKEDYNHFRKLMRESLDDRIKDDEVVLSFMEDIVSKCDPDKQYTLNDYLNMGINTDKYSIEELEIIKSNLLDNEAYDEAAFVQYIIKNR